MMDLGTLGGTDSTAHGINDSGQVMGDAQDALDRPRAFVWTQGGGTVDLGTLGGPYSYARGMNDRGQVVGFSLVDMSSYHAFLWTQGEGMVDLGTLGGPNSYARGVNETGQVVGESQNADHVPRAFSWTQSGGMVALGTLGGRSSHSYALGANDGGQVVGRSDHASGGYHGFSWTQAGGMVDLGTLGGRYSDALGINNSGHVVGWAYDASGSQRAFVWSADRGMVDLNTITSLPPGLTLGGASAILDDGVILAGGNTGLVLLVPGPLSNNTPVSGPVQANDPIAAGAALRADASFTDADAADLHTASWDWGDGSPVFPGTIVESGGAGSVTASHVYASAGIYPAMLTISDDTGRSVQVARDIVVYDPSAGFVTGGGWIQSPPGAYELASSLAGRADFGFVSRYQKGAQVPSGSTEFHFHVANLNFHSDTYEWLVVAGARAQYKGVGTVNGMGVYRFMLTAIDGDRLGAGQSDRFRIKIWYYDADLEEDVVVYDNQIDTGLEGTEREGTTIGGGSIVIHAK
jgi:probable HAF family extracellular repeat protein